jgi:hypothetical protein
MLTVKLYATIVIPPPANPPGGETSPIRRPTIKILEASEIDIYILRPGELYEVAGVCCDGHAFAYYVADDRKPKPEGFAEETVFWYTVYIENSAGATTHSLKF